MDNQALHNYIGLSNFRCVLIWFVANICLLVISAYHWYTVALVSQSDTQQQQWASLGGGAGFAYVFVHLLLELAYGGIELSETIGMIAYTPTHLVETLLFWSYF